MYILELIETGLENQIKPLLRRYVVLYNLSIMMASFTPFISEYIFNSIGFNESVHNKTHSSIIIP